MYKFCAILYYDIALLYFNAQTIFSTCSMLGDFYLQYSIESTSDRYIFINLMEVFLNERILFNHSFNVPE
jgi:hypothetical protein